MKAIREAVSLLGTLGRDGGLLGLSATILSDFRFIDRRLDAMKHAADDLGDLDLRRCLEDAAQVPGRLVDAGSWAPRLAMSLAKSPNRDLRAGADFVLRSSQFESLLGDGLNPSPLPDLEQYFESRVPGLFSILQGPGAQPFYVVG